MAASISTVTIAAVNRALLNFNGYAFLGSNSLKKVSSEIKQLQKTTGAKIRIEEPQVESLDRVVVVIAPSTIRSKIWLKTPTLGNVNNGGGGDFEEDIDVSKAQEGLLRVFERILEVTAKTRAIAVGVGVLSCRFFVEAAQVGSVIGNWGKVVEKIKKEIGCKIKVFTRLCCSHR